MPQCLVVKSVKSLITFGKKNTQMKVYATARKNEIYK